MTNPIRPSLSLNIKNSESDVSVVFNEPCEVTEVFCNAITKLPGNSPKNGWKITFTVLSKEGPKYENSEDVSIGIGREPFRNNCTKLPSTPQEPVYVDPDAYQNHNVSYEGLPPIHLETLPKKPPSQFDQKTFTNPIYEVFKDDRTGPTKQKLLKLVKERFNGFNKYCQPYYKALLSNNFGDAGKISNPLSSMSFTKNRAGQGVLETHIDKDSEYGTSTGSGCGRPVYPLDSVYEEPNRHRF